MNKYWRVALTLLVCSYFWYYVTTYADWHFIDSVDVIFHEAGHWIFIFFGEWIKILMGSGTQILLPFLIAIYFFRTNQKLSGSLCLLWTGVNFLNVSIYAGDAIAQNLPLLGGDGVIHDWNYLLSTSGMLSHTAGVAEIIYSLGILCMIAGTGLGLYFARTENSIINIEETDSE